MAMAVHRLWFKKSMRFSRPYSSMRTYRISRYSFYRHPLLIKIIFVSYILTVNIISIKAIFTAKAIIIVEYIITAQLLNCSPP